MNWGDRRHAGRSMATRKVVPMRSGAGREVIRRPAPRRLPGLNRWLRGAMLLAGLAAVALALTAVGNRIWQALAPAAAGRWEPVAFGTVDVAAAGTALVAHPEYVQVAPAAGVITRVEPPGRFVRSGMTVVRLAGGGGGGEVTADRPGLVNYAVDGLETEVATMLHDLSTGTARPGSGWVEQMLPRALAGPGDTVRAGEPIFKLVDPSQTWVAISLPETVLGAVYTGQGLRVELPATRDAIAMTVVDRSPTAGGRALVVLESHGQFPETLMLARQTPVRIVSARFEGIVVARAALARQGGETGVWALIKGERQFVPVKVLGGNDEQVAIQASLAIADQVWVPRAP